MLYLASSVLMNNALISTAASIPGELGSQMSSGPPVVWTLGLRQTLIKKSEASTAEGQGHCKVLVTFPAFWKMNANQLCHSSILKHNFSTVFISKWQCWQGELPSETCREIAHKHIQRQGFWGETMFRGLKSTWLQMGHRDQQMERVPSTTEFRGWLWQIWMSPWLEGAWDPTATPYPFHALLARSISAGALYRSCFNSIITGKCSKGSIRHKASFTR